MAKAGHAIVIGGSLAGLLAARTLGEHFSQVTLIERDAMHDEPESRKGQPQTRHIHALLASGTAQLARMFPDLLDDLAAGGALVGDMAERMRWFTQGGYRQAFLYGRHGVMVSRPFLEWHVRRRVTALPNVTVRDQTSVAGLEATADGARVSGVRLANPGEGQPAIIAADLVLDATGRGSALPRWLIALGYEAPPESEVKVNVGYATRFFRRDPADPLALSWMMITPDAPRERRSGFAFPMEGDRWVVTLGGWFGDYPPTDEEGFLAHARSLPCQDVADIIARSEPLTEIRPYRFPANQRRHYERLARFPEGMLALGDALCSFNPIYGQGMTSAALQAGALDALLAERGGDLDGIAMPFFKRAAKVIDIPWQLAVGEDFRFPEADGPRPPAAGLIHRYVDLVNRASHHDPVVCAAFLDVMNLLKPPASLFAPPVLLRTLRYGRTRTEPQARPATA